MGLTVPAEHRRRIAGRDSQYKRTCIVLFLGILAGCASSRAPQLTEAASHVEKITAEQGLSCDYLRNVDFTAKLSGIGKGYDVVHEAGETGVRNLVADIGGNAYVDTRMDTDTTWGNIHYSAQAFRCPLKILVDFGLAGRPSH